jgi:hypothetical protein
MPVIFLTLLLCSCSPYQADNNAQASTKYPNVPTMSAAEDAGKVK